MRSAKTWDTVLDPEVVYRLGVCLATYLVAFVLVAFPLPFLTVESVTRFALWLLMAPVEGHFQYCYMCGLEGIYRYLPYFQLAAIVAAVVTHPVLIYQILALVSPASVSRNRLYLTTFAAYISFIVGILFGYIVLLPVGIGVLINWNPISIEVRWGFSEYISTVSTLLVCVGLAFEIPTLLRGLGQLGVLTRRRSPS